MTATEGAIGRGTLGAKLGRHRVEITTYRGGGDTTSARVAADAEHRDMTIGALYWQLWDDAIADPTDGIADWKSAVIRSCGAADERIREHPIRSVRYLRRAAELGFSIDSATRKAVRNNAVSCAAAILPEALAEELRRVLERCASPGVFFQLCCEELLLEHLLPEVAPQFDGRPAGRVRWHPEISQALHMVLALKTAGTVADEAQLDAQERVRLMLCVLCHDLGKGTTTAEALPSHPGHEAGGVPIIEQLFERLPSLGSKRTKRLCKVAARTHLLLDGLRDLGNGTLVDLWDEALAPHRQDFATLARVVRCDQEGRLSTADLGLPERDAPPNPSTLEHRIHSDLQELDGILAAVSGEESADLFPGDPAGIRSHLRDLRCRTLAASGFCRNKKARMS